MGLAYVKQGDRDGVSGWCVHGFRNAKARGPRAPCPRGAGSRPQRLTDWTSSTVTG
ncbi:hypothetical protein GCM10010245_44230 [Streptomyces spectabilis]|nr:hypothetical protein GCM10010245_44230 [Streptomyces spectabilis]